MVITKQLFLSKRLVTENDITDGGVLVDEHGIIENLLTREQANQLLAESNDKITVILSCSLLFKQVPSPDSAYLRFAVFIIRNFGRM